MRYVAMVIFFFLFFLRNVLSVNISDLLVDISHFYLMFYMLMVCVSSYCVLHVLGVFDHCNVF